jgi:hypothetical protein
MDKKEVEDKLLFLLQSELRCHKATRTILKERLLHTDYLIADVEKKILEHINGETLVTKHIN